MQPQNEPLDKAAHDGATCVGPRLCPSPSAVRSEGQRARPLSEVGRIIVALATVLVVLLLVRTAVADERSRCTGPERCCPTEIFDESPPRRKTVDVGVALIGIYDISEKNSTWTADFYLYEAWSPSRGFTPQTEIFNEVNRIAEQFDRTELKGDRCLRSRRIRTTLHTPYNLRIFPFDRQTLTLQLSDAEFASDQLGYAGAARSAGFEDAVLQQLSGWKFEDDKVGYSRTQRPFKWEEGAPDYDYATFSVDVRRHVSFHLAKYFLPLLLIVIVAFTVFWVDPDDLASEVQIGVTCLLAAIALEFTEGSSLPDVNYLTIADRTFSICYVAIGLAVVQSVFTNRLARNGKKDKALWLDKKSRVVFPTLLVIFLVLATVRAYTQ